MRAVQPMSTHTDSSALTTLTKLCNDLGLPDDANLDLEQGLSAIMVNIYDPAVSPAIDRFYKLPHRIVCPDNPIRSNLHKIVFKDESSVVIIRHRANVFLHLGNATQDCFCDVTDSQQTCKRCTP